MTTLISGPSRPRPALAQGDARWFFGQLAIIRATGADTGGAYSLIEVHCPPGLEAPLHVHHAEDEGFLILEGDVEFEVGDDTISASAGTFLLGPKDIPHRFRVTSPEGAKMLWVMTPSGFENLIAATSVPAEGLVPPPPGVLPPENAAEIVRGFGNELVA